MLKEKKARELILYLFLHLAVGDSLANASGVPKTRIESHSMRKWRREEFHEASHYLLDRLRDNSTLNEAGFACMWHESALECRAGFARSTDRTETSIFEDVLAKVLPIGGRHDLQC